MHSGVYAVSPESAADIVLALVSGALVELSEQEVRDIDEEAFRAGIVRAQYFGELLVPSIGGFLQHVKSGGREQEALVLVDIADHIIEAMDSETLYIMGPGSTAAAIMAELALDNTLLGFDAVCDSTLQGSDLSALDITALIASHKGPVKAVITVIGGQGHILGRGNQQLTPAVIRQIGRDNFIIIATKTKISQLDGRPLLVDSNDPALDIDWQGYIHVVTGYRDMVMYRVSASGD
jgi:predicted polyphosphate/ATP-dependent NAD kinase